MPPWGADDTGLCGKWKGALWLTDHELQTIVTWTAGDKPPGEPAKVRELPPPARFEKNGPTLDMGADYRPGIGALAYRCFVVDPKLDRDRLVSAFRVTSTEPRSVAQITLYTLDASAEAKAIELDRDDDGPGYTCYGSSRGPEARLVTSWTWDGPVLRLPDNVGIRLRGREKLVMQVHYDVIATGPNVPTRTRIELELDDAAREASFWDISPDSLSLAPGRALVEASSEVAVNRTRTVLGIAPRMHTASRTILRASTSRARSTAFTSGTSETSQTRCILSTSICPNSSCSTSTAKRRLPSSRASKTPWPSRAGAARASSSRTRRLPERTYSTATSSSTRITA
jgi:hypothetical protein